MNAAFLLLLLLAQDPAEQVRALVEKLGSDDIAVREEATGKLVQLGPPALPALFAQVARADEARKIVLKRVVRKIERNEREARLSRPGPRVTLKVKDKPAADVLSEITKQSGVDVKDGGLADDTLLTLDATDLPLAAAVDSICKTHGKIAAQWTPGGLHLVPGKPRALPAFHRGPFSFLPELEWATKNPAKDPKTYVGLSGGLVGPRDIFPQAAWIEMQSATDERGRNLGRNDGPGSEVFRTGNSFSMPLVPDGVRVFQPVTWLGVEPVSPTAKKVKFKGAVRVKVVLDYKTAVAIKNPLAAPATKDSAAGSTLEILKWTRTGAELSVTYKAIKPAGGPAWKVGDFDRGLPLVLEDPGGRRVWGKVQGENIVHREDPAGNRWEFSGSTEFTLPEGFEPATMELLEPEETIQPAIPFELTDVTFR